MSFIPTVPQGSYLWSRTTYRFNTGEPVIVHSVSRMGRDGLGTLRTVNGIVPDEDGNANLSAEDVGALPVSGGGLFGHLNMTNHSISSVADPTAETDAANKKYVDQVHESIVSEMKLMSLWTNPSPSDDFESQTIVCDMATPEHTVIHCSLLAIRWRIL